MQPIDAYRITPDGSLPLKIQATTLDELTKQLAAGFYTTFRTFDNGERALGLKAHFRRLFLPDAEEGLIPDVAPATLRNQMAKIIKTYQSELRIRLVLTLDGKVYIAVTPLTPLPPEIYLRGVKVFTANVQRQRPRLKTTAFISASEDVRTKISSSADFEALLVRNNRILEGMTSNFFYISDGMLGTAQKDILLGVTRRTVLRVARGSGLDIVYRPLKRKQIPTLSEAFLTSSSRGIVPIIQIDDVMVGEGNPGPITKTLMENYKIFVMRTAERI